MRVERVADAADFLSRTADVRSRSPVLTNVMGTIAQGVVAGRVYDESWWWLVLDDSGQTVACAIRTTPWNLILGPMDDAAARALAVAVAAQDPELPGLNGPLDVVLAVGAALPGARELQVTMRDVVLVLDELVEPVGVPGAAVTAQLDEVDKLLVWHAQFAVDAGLPGHNMEAGVRSRLAAGGFLWWVVDGEQVCLAGHTDPVPIPGGGAVGRIGPVYTPAEHRRHGYAAALTSAAVRRLQPACSVVMLFADADNPTSNGVYERLGFRLVDEIVEATLAPAEPASERR